MAKITSKSSGGLSSDSGSLGHLKAGLKIEEKSQQDFEHFMQKIDGELLNHRVITANVYTDWFSRGQVTHEQLQMFIVQFSVFSNQFLLAQLLKMLSADSLEDMRASKEILANELGVAFHAASPVASSVDDLSGAEQRSFGDITGSVEGGRFHFRAAHFELLLRCAQSLGLDFQQLGKRHHGTQGTLFFCDELKRLYASDDYQTAAAASFAVENWAAAGFWQQLEDGFSLLKQRAEYSGLPVTFFSWHNKLEANHAHHTQQELKEYYFSHRVDEDAFIATGNEMLNGVEAFWRGLDLQRQDRMH